MFGTIFTMPIQTRSSAPKELADEILTADASKKASEYNLSVEEPVPQVVCLDQDDAGDVTPGSQQATKSSYPSGYCEGCSKLRLDIELMRKEIENLKRNLNLPAENRSCTTSEDMQIIERLQRNNTSLINTVECLSRQVSLQGSVNRQDNPQPNRDNSTGPTKDDVESSKCASAAMAHYLKPNLDLKPNEVILHVGTNDLKSHTPEEAADKIVDLARQVEGSSEARVAISALVKRKGKLIEKVTQANKLLKRFCSQNEWKFIEHLNISHKSLNRGGLHLTEEGNKRFFDNFRIYLNN